MCLYVCRGRGFFAQRKAAQVLCMLESPLTPCKQGLSDIPQPTEYFPRLFISFACEVVANHDISIQKILHGEVE